VGLRLDHRTHVLRLSSPTLAETDRVALPQGRLAVELAGPLHLRIMEMPGASQATREALCWCEDYDDDPAHRWLRRKLQVLAPEV
jgi:hypothetical protein